MHNIVVNEREMKDMLYIIHSITAILMVYGIITFVEDIIKAKRIINNNIRLVIEVKNAEDEIEGIIRNAIEQKIVEKSLLGDILYIRDLESSDKTKEIIEMLSRDNSFIQLLES